jgi:hypothetical protein
LHFFEGVKTGAGIMKIWDKASRSAKNSQEGEKVAGMSASWYKETISD